MSTDCSNMQTTLVSTSCESLVSKTSHLSSSSQSHHKTPLLMVSPDVITGIPSAELMLRNQCDSYMYSVDAEYKPCCIGSCKGLMVLRQCNYEDGEFYMFLFNPSSRKARKIVIPDKGPVSFSIRNIHKAIPIMNTFQSGYKYGLAFVYGLDTKEVAVLLVHDEQDQENKWINLAFSDVRYEDVVCNKQYLFALSTRDNVEIWDLMSIKNDSVYRKVQIETCRLPYDDVAEVCDEVRDLYTCKMYLVESQGNLFMVLRFVGEFVRDDGVVVTEGDLLGDDSSYIIAPYKTKNFYVYKLDLHSKKWMAVDSIGDQVFFLGLNQSVCLKASGEFQANSIYFTDDYWDHINVLENDEYGGHDIGTFSLDNRSVMEIIELKRMIPPPLWVEQDNCSL